MTTLHVGTFRPAELIELMPNDVTVYRDEDSWEEWHEGQHPGHPEHVVFRGRASHEYLADIAWIQQEAPGLLMPMTWKNQAGALAVMTPDNDYSAPYFEVMDVHARNFLRENFWAKDPDELKAERLHVFEYHVQARVARAETVVDPRNEHHDPDPWLWKGWEEYLYLAREEPLEDSGGL